MIDSFAAPTAMNETRPDVTYQSWQGSLRKTTMRFDMNDRTAGPIPSFGTMVHRSALAAQEISAYAPSSSMPTSETRPDIAIENKDELTFADVIDVINPLQHLPVVGMIYRKFTGDVIKPMSEIIGGAIFGGPVGAVSSTVNAIVKTQTGRDIAENAFAMVGFDITPDGATKPDINYAKATNAYNRNAETVDMVRKNFAAVDVFSPQSWNA